jgi:hypothetical protein
MARTIQTRMTSPLLLQRFYGLLRGVPARPKKRELGTNILSTVASSNRRRVLPVFLPSLVSVDYRFDRSSEVFLEIGAGLPMRPKITG